MSGPIWNSDYVKNFATKRNKLVNSLTFPSPAFFCKQGFGSYFSLEVWEKNLIY